MMPTAHQQKAPVPGSLYLSAMSLTMYPPLILQVKYAKPGNGNGNGNGKAKET